MLLVMLLFWNGADLCRTSAVVEKPTRRHAEARPINFSDTNTNTNAGTEKKNFANGLVNEHRLQRKKK